MTAIAALASFVEDILHDQHLAHPQRLFELPHLFLRAGSDKSNADLAINDHIVRMRQKAWRRSPGSNRVLNGRFSSSLITFPNLAALLDLCFPSGRSALIIPQDIALGERASVGGCLKLR